MEKQTNKTRMDTSSTADFRFSPTVRRITQLHADASGSVTSTVLYESQRKKKKGSIWWLRPFDVATRRLAQSQLAFAQTYLSDHGRANSERRNGWIIDFVPNVLKAQQKSLKALKLDRILFP